jgi:hypothetical protein
MSDYNPGLLGVNNAQDSTLSTIILDNFISFYDWGFLDKGGYNNINIPNSGMYGGSKAELRPAKDPNYADGRVWQGFRENWVWETGINRATEPNQISGVYVNNTFLPYTYNSASGYYTGPSATGYRIDFIDGRVVFNTPIASTATVKLNYSYKWVKVDRSEGVGFFRQIQSNDFRIDNNFLTGSGEWVQLGQTRIQLPAIFVEVVPNRTYQPYQLGGGQWANTDVLFYAMSNREADCSNLLNIISYQNDRYLKLFNTNKVSRSGAYPMTFVGDLVDKKYNYPYLVENYTYGNLRVFDSKINNITQISVDFYIGTARCSTQIELVGVT